MKESGLEALGIIVDSDFDPASRWSSLRNRLLPLVPAFPVQAPAEGLLDTLILDVIQIRFGVWMMPDCCSSGMMETFMALLVPDSQHSLVGFARHIALAAKSGGATYKTPHQQDKAVIYSWLAWQDEPGRQLHDAIKHTILQPTHPNAKPFMDWFQKLCDLRPTTSQ